MAQSVEQLMAELKGLGKSASQIENATDPGVKGEFSPSVEDKKLLPALAGQSASLDVPAVTAQEPAGEFKTEQGDVSAPSPEAFGVEGAAAKTASPILADIGNLRSKLAAIGQSVVPAAPAAPAVTAPAAPAAPAVSTPSTDGLVPEKSAAEYVPGDFLMKVAFHLMSTANGQKLVLDALEEIDGQKVAAELVKRAADESADFLRNYTIERLQEAAYAEDQMKQAAAQQQAEAHYAELIKGASAEELKKIEDSSFMLKRAEAIFVDNPVAHGACQIGFSAATKAAAAMEAGMDPAMAGAEAAGAPPEDAPASPEELMQALQVLVEQGIIQPEEAEQLLAQLAGGGAEAGVPPADPAMEQKAAAVDAALQKIASIVP